MEVLSRAMENSFVANLHFVLVPTFQNLTEKLSCKPNF
ncbi:hypothetical protein LEP1GSC020_4307 [Leptospira interrogans serovar Grippotyphosa str. 2006006986]|nr:hypothetical protein LEP1GSC020_4307 [Leptospira interrogans serovar Grippotyphosa str. 2006006986]